VTAVKFPQGHLCQVPWYFQFVQSDNCPAISCCCQIW